MRSQFFSTCVINGRPRLSAERSPLDNLIIAGCIRKVGGNSTSGCNAGVHGGFWLPGVRYSRAPTDGEGVLLHWGTRGSRRSTRLFAAWIVFRGLERRVGVACLPLRLPRSGSNT